MKKFMVITKNPETGEQSANFYDKFNDAQNSFMDYECGLGWQVELYEYMREDPDDENEPESYLQIM